MTNRNNVSRRNFLRLSSLTGMALTIGYYMPAMGKTPSGIINAATAESMGVQLNAWISIDTNGIVTIFNHRSEMGQGSWQSVPQVIAEELEVDLDQVNIEFAPGAPEKFGSQITGGSSTVRGAFKQLLQTGATAREMLISAAAAKWNVQPSECYAENGFVINRSNKEKLSYGALVEAASKLEVPKDVKLKERKDYKIIGKPLKRQDNGAKVNGKAIFGIDKRVEGMMYAAVERSPRFHGKIKSYDDTAAKAVPGVKQVIKVSMPVFGFTREGVAVIADNTWAAMQGKKALKVVWDDEGFEHNNSAELAARMKEDLKKDGEKGKNKGNALQMLKDASNVVEAVYETPFQTHSAMEPLNCTAHFQGDKIEVWGPIQAPDWVRNDLSEKFKLSTENVLVNMTFLGGGFGRKAFTDYPYEAVLISKEIKAPVQVVWTREDDMTQGPFRPAMTYQCRALLDGNKITAFEGKAAGKNMDAQESLDPKAKPNGSVTEGFPEPYLEHLENYYFSDISTKTSIPVMWWRSVYASTNAFAYESFMDELAIKAKADPIEFRRTNLKNERYLKLLDKLEEVSGWKNCKSKEGWGVAVTECFDSIVGEVVKVSNKGGKVVIDKAFAVMDCGWYVNPEIIRQQVEGSIIMAYGAAVKHETTFKDGKAVETNFNSYRMPRINETPEIEVFIMENNEKPGGVGEPALPPFAPALTNAIYDLTGKRIRKLPFVMG
ncbi:MAG: molybdopterin cofactor-binding domain-containing protein [Flavitalea sp.]